MWTWGSRKHLEWPGRVAPWRLHGARAPIFMSVREVVLLLQVVPTSRGPPLPAARSQMTHATQSQEYRCASPWTAPLTTWQHPSRSVPGLSTMPPCGSALGITQCGARTLAPSVRAYPSLSHAVCSRMAVTWEGQRRVSAGPSAPSRRLKEVCR